MLADIAARSDALGWTRSDAGVVIAADPDGAVGVAVLCGVDR